MFATLPKRSNPSVPAIAPGTMPTTLTLCGPHSHASTLVKASTPALAAELCAYNALPFQCNDAEMLIITPPLSAIDPLKAA